MGQFVWIRHRFSKHGFLGRSSSGPVYVIYKHLVRLDRGRFLVLFVEKGGVRRRDGKTTEGATHGGNTTGKMSGVYEIIGEPCDLAENGKQMSPC